MLDAICASLSAFLVQLQAIVDFFLLGSQWEDCSKRNSVFNRLSATLGLMW